MKKFYFLVLILSTFLSSCSYPTYETYENYEVSCIDEYSMEYIKENEKLDKTFTYVYRPSWEFMKFGITYEVTEFYENHFIKYIFGIFNLNKLDDIELVRFRTGDYIKNQNGYILKYAKEYDVDTKKYYCMNQKEDLVLYQKHVWPEHSIESLVDYKKITVTFTTPSDVLTDYSEYGYFELYNMKLTVEDCVQ